MTDAKYLIVGGGMTGDMAAKGIRDQDPGGSIAMIGEDPIRRTRGRCSRKGCGTDGGEDLARAGGGRRARHRPPRRRARPRRHSATDDAGDKYGYEELLLATGGGRADSRRATV